MNQGKKYNILIFGTTSPEYSNEINTLNGLLAQHDITITSYTPNGYHKDYMRHLYTFFGSSDEQSPDGIIFLDHQTTTEIAAKIAYLNAVPSVIYEPSLENIAFTDTIAGIHFDSDMNKISIQRARNPEEAIAKLIQQIEQSRQNGRN